MNTKFTVAGGWGVLSMFCWYCWGLKDGSGRNQLDCLQLEDESYPVTAAVGDAPSMVLAFALIRPAEAEPTEL